MSNLEDKLNILKINYSDTGQLKKVTTELYKQKFNWKSYVKYYPDLDINNLNTAWEHWVKHGLNEKRYFFLNEDKNINQLKLINKVQFNQNGASKPIIKNTIKKDTTTLTLKKLIIDKTPQDNLNFKIRLLRKNNLIYKNIYDNYGLHYYGWKEVINNFIKNFEKITNFKQQYFFDEWIEKFLIWGDKVEKNFYLREIYNNGYKLITFIHNPPFQKWYNNDYKSYIKNKIIYDNEHTNKTLIKDIEDYDLNKQIVFFYTLCNYHKEYLYNKCPEFNNKLMSINHPIEINGSEKCFEFSLFCQNKQILHIGWWLRNFKTFIDFKQPKEFHKTILVKSDFENEWNKISTEYKLDNITIIKELSNSEYEKIFTNSCLFIDLEDSCANNTILECIKFNTPIIVNKIPAVVEYLGENYPLYIKNPDDLKLLNSPTYLLSQIENANKYLTNMDKKHVSLEAFNNKLNYDLNKLDNTNDSCLTWFCLIDDLDNIDKKMNHLYNIFVSQYDNSKLQLHIVVLENLCNEEKYNNFIENIKKYSDIVFNITFSVKYFDNYSDFLNYSVGVCETTYLVIVDIQDYYEKNFSSYFINYLNDNPNCDVAFSSYKITNDKDYTEEYIFQKDLMLFNSNHSTIIMPETGIVWRKDMNKIIGDFIPFKDKKYIFRDYWIKTITQKFNIKCCNDEILYISKIY